MVRAKAPDRRVGRTRRLLRDALVSLILERGWDRVSVLDVCAQADVGRSTFYLHFADKEELLLSGFDDLRAALEAERLTREGAFAFVETLITHAQDHQRLFRAVVGRQSGHAVHNRFRDVVLALVEAELGALRVDQRERASMALYVCGGFVALLAAWLDKPSQVDPRSLAVTFRRMTESALRAKSA